ncbi:MAG: hypothetical protein RIT45_568, partial [Pseudomonadota bacterium]
PTRSTMRENYRTDAALLDAMNALWGGERGVFGAVGFDYVEVEAPSGRAQPASRLQGRVREGATWRSRQPLELRWLAKRATPTGTSEDGADEKPVSSLDEARPVAAELCADEIVALLAGDHSVGGKAARPVQPSDIAVLVRTHRQAGMVGDALRGRGVPVVAPGRSKVVDAVVVDWVLAWLDAVAAPSDEAAARTLALSPLCGWTPAALDAALAEASGARWDAFRAGIAAAAERYERRGFFGAFDRALEDAGGLATILRLVQGERHGTDLRHLIELLHREERRARPSAAGLAAWLRQRRAGGGEGEEDEQRLESDARAVQIVTIHRSKGLEYPIVLLPYAWDGQPRRGELLFHDEDGHLCLDLHPDHAPARDDAKAIAEREHEEEQMRLLYVAMTRAAQHLVVWHGIAGRNAVPAARSGALGRLLHPTTDDDAPTGPLGVATRQRAAAIGAGFRVEQPPLGARWQRPNIDTSPRPGGASPLARERWDDGWQLTSYTGVARGLPHARTAASELELAEQLAAVALDERALRALDNAAPDAEAGEGPTQPGDRALAAQARAQLPDALLRERSLHEEPALAGLLRGKDVGVWVHAVLEHLDFRTARTGALRDRDGGDGTALVERLAARHGIRDPRAAAALLDALPAMLTTPLDGGDLGLPAGFCLADLEPIDRVDELGFDLGVGQGPETPVQAAAVAAALAKTRAALPGWDGLGWLDALLAHPEQLFPQIHGVLKGFVDLCFRFRDAQGEQRYVICDYKTNRLSLPGDRRRSPRLAYARESLAAAMAEHHYPLQALLYTVALHRLLRHRLGEAYDPERAQAGYLYLFVRGMEGPTTPRHRGTALGVYAGRWPHAVVAALDAALEGEAVR